MGMGWEPGAQILTHPHLGPPLEREDESSAARLNCDRVSIERRKQAVPRVVLEVLVARQLDRA
jgi:hypothetical protein